MDEPVQDFELVVKVRMHGGTAEEAASVLRDHESAFDADGVRILEIIDVQPARP